MKYATDRTDLNLSKIPCHWLSAKDHAQASKAGIPKSDQPQSRVCQCCFLQIQKQPLKLNCSISDIEQVGIQFSMLFQLTKICGLLLVLILLNTGIIFLHDSYQNETNKQLYGGFQIVFTPIKSADIPDTFPVISTLGFLVQLFTISILNVLMSHRIETKYSASADQHLASKSIIIKNIPKGINAKERIKQLFTNNFDYINILNIVLINDNESMSEVLQQRDDIVSDWKKLMRQKKRNHQSIRNGLRKLTYARQKISERKQTILNNQDQWFSGTAIVTFQETQSKLKVVDSYKKGFFNKHIIEESFGELKFNDEQPIIIKNCYKPSQIIWHKLAEPERKLTVATHLSYIYMALVISGIFLVYFLTQLVFSRSLPSSQKIEEKELVLGSIWPIVILSIVTNTIMPLLITIIEYSGLKENLTSFHIGIVNKTLASQLLIKSLIVLLIEVIFSQETVGENNARAYQIAIATVINLTRLLCIDSTLVILLNSVYSSFLYKRFRHASKISKNSLTQTQANQFLEDPSFSISSKSAQILGLFIISYMVSDVIPIITLLTPLTLFALYWVNKFNFIRRSSLESVRVSKKYSQNIVRIMSFTMITKPVMNIVIIGLVQQRADIAQIVMFLISCVYILVSREFLKTHLSKILKLPTVEEYPQSKQEVQILKHGYTTVCPLTSNPQSRLVYLNQMRTVKNKKTLKLMAHESESSRITMADIQKQDEIEIPEPPTARDLTQ